MKEIVRKFGRLLQDRLLSLSQVSPDSNLIQVLLGPRQVGKTTAVQQIAREWAGPVVFESADLPVTPTTDWILGHWQKARSLGTQDTLLAIDEIQKIQTGAHR